MRQNEDDTDSDEDEATHRDPEEGNGTESVLRDPVNGTLSAACRRAVQDNVLSNSASDLNNQAKKAV